MSDAAFVIVCFSGACTAGFGFAFYMSLLAMDKSELEELGRDGFFVNHSPPLSMIVRHWQTRPQVRRCLLFAVLSGVILAATLLLDSHFAAPKHARQRTQHFIKPQQGKGFFDQPVADK